MSPRRSVENELTRDMIITTARDLFVANGYSHVTMRKIAQALNYSHGAIYYHFTNKAEIFYAIVSSDFSLLNQKLDKIMIKNLEKEEKIKQILLGFMKFGLAYPNHYEIMFLTRDEEVKGYLQQVPNETYESFAQAIYELCNKKINSKEIWSVFLSIHGFVAVHCRNKQTYEEVKGLAETHVTLILRAIRS